MNVIFFRDTITEQVVNVWRCLNVPCLAHEKYLVLAEGLGPVYEHEISWKAVCRRRVVVHRPKAVLGGPYKQNHPDRYPETFGQTYALEWGERWGHNASQLPFHDALVLDG